MESLNKPHVSHEKTASDVGHPNALVGAGFQVVQAGLKAGRGRKVVAEGDGEDGGERDCGSGEENVHEGAPFLLWCACGQDY